ncbi:MAG: DUF368 domain-containing protein [Actinomycetota bacterium]
MTRLIRTVAGGFLMGTADLVPGVSGGTIALVLGIYERLVSSIREGSSALGSLLRADTTGFAAHLRRVEWLFLLPLLAGILLAVGSLASFLDHQLEQNPTILAAVFFGLVLGSVAIAWRLLRDPDATHLVVAAAVGVGLFLLLGLGEETLVRNPSSLAFFGAGALAICAMILPGISGSLILLLVGMYAAVLDAVDQRELSMIAIFVSGAVVGLGLFSQVLYWALRKHHDVILAGLVGLMGGSLRVLWPWPDGVESTVLGAPADDVFGVAVSAVVGFAAVFLVARLAEKEDERISEPQPSG